jgi:hypothetical protein
VRRRSATIESEAINHLVFALPQDPEQRYRKTTVDATTPPRISASTSVFPVANYCENPRFEQYSGAISRLQEMVWHNGNRLTQMH